MAYKRQIDRLPIVPKDAKEHNVTCHFCIVGCGYKAYTWPANKQGGTAPDQNKFGVDLSKQQAADTPAWYAPSMYNIVKQNGSDVHIGPRADIADLGRLEAFFSEDFAGDFDEARVGAVGLARFGHVSNTILKQRFEFGKKQFFIAH